MSESNTDQSGSLNLDAMHDAARRHDEFMAEVYASDGEWTVCGWDDDGLRVLVEYNPLAGTTTHGLNVCREFPLACDRARAETLVEKVSIMDEHYWPPVNPILGRVEDGRVVALAAPKCMTDEGRAYVRDLAEREGLRVE